MVEVEEVDEGGVVVVNAKGTVFNWGEIAFGGVDGSYGRRVSIRGERD